MEDEAQGQSPSDMEAGEVLDAVGMAKEPEESTEDSTQGQENHDPLYVQKRLKQQKRAHEREMRDLHARLNEMQSQQAAPNSYANPYEPQMHGSAPPGIDEQIHKAVSYALQHRDMEERKAKEAEQRAHVNKQYQELQRHLDTLSDKYEDFDDVVRGSDVPFTETIRDSALFLPKKGPGSAGEVLYKLGKNPEELSRISRLHPLDQASELVKLSHALISGGENKMSQSNRPLGQIKSNPVINSNYAITEKTPVGDIRKRMRSNWK